MSNVDLRKRTVHGPGHTDTDRSMYRDPRRPVTAFRGTSHNQSACWLAAVLTFVISGLLLMPALASGASTGSIAGTVTDATTSEPLAGIWACAYEPGAEAASEFVNCRQTDASGEYTILELPASPYKVAFIDVNSTYASQFYKEGAPQGVPFFEDADAVPVSEGATTVGIDAQLLKGAGKISGNVTDDSSASLKGIRVCFIPSATSKGVACVYTDTSGDYTVLGLPAPGSYKVAFIDKAGVYPTRFYDGKASLEEADPVPVNVGETTSGIDAVLRNSDVLGSTLSGYVESASGEHAVDAPVAICPVGGSTCRVLSTDPQGIYQATGVTDGAYRITAYPPAGSNERPASVEATVAGGDVTAPDIKLLPPLPPPPAGTTIESLNTNPDGIPVVFVGTSPILSTGGCPGGIATFEIEVEEEIVSSGTFTESPEGSGQYFGHTGVLLAHGAAIVTISITNCPNPEENKKIVFGIYIDPSGVVKDAALGTPIADATVTLFRSGDANGPFTQVPDGSAIMSPANRSNPDTTDAKGHFGWDVIAGYYRVQASAAGCASATTDVLSIPPPVTDLNVQLDCGNGKKDGGGGGSTVSSSPAATPSSSPAATPTQKHKKKHRKHKQCRKKKKHGHKKKCGKKKGHGHHSRRLGLNTDRLRQWSLPEYFKVETRPSRLEI